MFVLHLFAQDCRDFYIFLLSKPRVDPVPYSDAGRDYWKDSKMRE